MIKQLFPCEFQFPTLVVQRFQTVLGDAIIQRNLNQWRGQMEQLWPVQPTGLRRSV